MEKRNQLLKLVISLVIVAAAFLLLSGLIGGELMYRVEDAGALTSRAAACGINLIV